MKPAPAIAATVLLALLGLWAWVGGKGVGTTAPAGPGPTPRAVQGSEPAGADALQASPQARAWQERQAFEARARRFMRDAPGLGAVQRSEQARDLSASIDHYESNGGLSAGESLLLRSGLIKASVDDPALQAQQLADLMERYRRHADQRMQAYTAQHANDPRFQDYKARERAIVAEVMGLAAIPGGSSRDQYLRQRLQQARVAAYR